MHRTAAVKEATPLRVTVPGSISCGSHFISPHAIVTACAAHGAEEKGAIGRSCAIDKAATVFFAALMV